MINFYKVVEDLLYEEDFLVLPGLGALIADFKVIDGSIPYKTFSFSPLIKQDENQKLWSYTLKKIGLPLPEIELQWNAFLSTLSTQKTKKFGDIGSFHENDKGVLEVHLDQDINFYVKNSDAENSYSIQKVHLQGIDSKDSVLKESPLPENPHPEKVNILPNDLEEEVSTFDEQDVVKEPEIAANSQDSLETIDEFTETVEIENTASQEEEVEDKEELEEEAYSGEELYMEEYQNRPLANWFWLVLPILLLGAALYYLTKSKFKTDTLPNTYSETMDSTENSSSDSLFLSEDGFVKDSLARRTFDVWAGLFSNRKNAENLRKKLVDNGLPAVVREVGNKRRVLIPSVSEEEAIRLVPQIQQLTGDKAVYFEVEE